MNEKIDTSKNASEYIRELEASIEYILNVEKDRKKQDFLNAVRSYAEMMGIDAVITEKEWGYVATLRIGMGLYNGVCKTGFEAVLHLADSFELYPAEDDSKDTLVSFSYDTHDTYIRGKRIEY